MKKGEKRQVKTGEVIICMSVFVVLSDAFREGWRVAGHAIRKAVKGNYLNFSVLDDWVAGSQVMHHDHYHHLQPCSLFPVFQRQIDF